MFPHLTLCFDFSPSNRMPKRRALMVVAASPSASSSSPVPSPRYNWSPCSSDSSSSTMSEQDTGAGGVFSSGEDADVEGTCASVYAPLAHCGGHVAVS